MNAPRCVICDYDLTGLPESPRCPECGFAHPPFAVRARLKATGGETWVTIVIGLVLVFAAIGGGLLAFIALVPWAIRAYGAVGSIVLMAIYLAWLVGSLFIMPAIARRFAKPDSRWDQVLSVTDEGLAIQLRQPDAQPHVTPWSMLKDARMKHTRRGFVHLKLTFLLTRNLPLPFRLTYTIDADGMRAAAIHQAIIDRIAQCRAKSTK